MSLGLEQPVLGHEPRELALTDEDRRWIGINYPSLLINEGGSQGLVIKGILRFHAYYDKAKDGYIFNPSGIIVDEKYDIADSYEISITSPSLGEDLPVVTETNGRILSLARARNLQFRDLHIYANGVCCLYPKPFDKIKYPKGINMLDFICDLVIPFFYSQSYFERYGYWHVKPYSHGDLGILEYYAELISKGYSVIDVVGMFFDSLEGTTQKQITEPAIISRQWACLYCKGTKFRKCHPSAMKGLKQLKVDYGRYMRKQQGQISGEVQNADTAKP
jgi:hypothetical protein